MKEMLSLEIIQQKKDGNRLRSTKIDLRLSRMFDSDLGKTTFRTHEGHYEIKALMNHI